MFKNQVRDTIDGPLLEELFPLGNILSDVHWEAHDGRTRLPSHLTEEHTAEQCRGDSGVTFGRQIGAYPILIGVEYHIPLETQSQIIITGHGARSITGVEIGMDAEKVSQKQVKQYQALVRRLLGNLFRNVQNKKKESKC